MRRLISSRGYARARLVSGALFIFLGAAILVRTLAATGASATAIPACALGGAMIALGALRFRDVRRARKVQ